MAFLKAHTMAMGMPQYTAQATVQGKAVVKDIDQGKAHTMVEGTAQADVFRTHTAKVQGTALDTVVEPLEDLRKLDTIPKLFKRNQRGLQ